MLWQVERIISIPSVPVPNKPPWTNSKVKVEISPLICKVPAAVPSASFCVLSWVCAGSAGALIPVSEAVEDATLKSEVPVNSFQVKPLSNVTIAPFWVVTPSVPPNLSKCMIGLVTVTGLPKAST